VYPVIVIEPLVVVNVKSTACTVAMEKLKLASPKAAMARRIAVFMYSPNSQV
jgi:hypothetical protein